MRKVLSLVLVLALVLGSTAFTFGAVPSDVAGTKYEEAVNVLMELDVISGYPDGSYKPAGIVTRGEMAKIVICALGLEDYAAGASSFSDMAGHWSDKYVAYAVSLGIINGYPDGTFKADNTVSYDEAAKMLVAALGYTEDALIGRWPANWVTKAKVLGIIKGVQSGSAGANRGDIATMTFQTLDKEMGKVNRDGEFVTHLWETGDSDTMLTRLGAKLYAPNAKEQVVGSEFIILDSTSSVINLKPYLGAYVKSAYANDDNKVIAIKEFGSIALDGSYDAAAKEFETIDGITYKTTRVDGDDVPYFNNGIAVADMSTVAAGDNIGATGSFDGIVNVEVSGKYIDAIYSFSTWVEEETFQVTEDMIDELDEDDTFNAYNFLMDDNDEIDLDNFALIGVDSLDEIEEDDIVTVYVEAPGTATSDIAKIEVSKTVVSGTISRIKGAATPYDFTVDGKVYAETTKAGRDLKTGLQAGDEVEFYLDYSGEIFVSKLVEAGETDLIGILLASAPGSTGLNGQDTKFEIYLPDGTTKIFVGDQDELVTNGILTGSYAFAAGTVYDDTLVEYDLNKDGEIVDIKLYAGLGNATTAHNAEVTAKGYYDSKEIAKDATVIIAGKTTLAAGVYTIDPLSNDKYEFKELKDVLGRDKLTTAEVIYSTDSKGLIDLIVLVGGGAIEDEIYGVVNAWFEDESDEGYGLEMLIDGKDVDKEAKKQTPHPGTWNGLIAANVLYEIELTDDVVTDLIPIAVGKTFASTSGTAVTLDSGIASYNDGAAKTISVLSDALVYVLKTDGWEKGKLNDIKVAVADAKQVIFYTLDDDAAGAANIILVK